LKPVVKFSHYPDNWLSNLLQDFLGAVTQHTLKGKKRWVINIPRLTLAYHTEKKQLLINQKNSVMLKSNKIFLSGDWRFIFF
jgi:hypothetical protein